MESTNLFISYSHKDKYYLTELLMNINISNCPNITVWYDEKISPGVHWNNLIEEKLNNSNIILLLLSPYFFISDYIKNYELKIAFENQAAGKCKIIPIFVRKCLVENHPEIIKLQGLPREKLFISDMGEEKWGHYAEIAQTLNKISEDYGIEKNISYSISNPVAINSNQAKNLDELRKNNKIFLSIPFSDEGKKKRRQFLYQVEGKIKYENWKFEIVPSISDMEELYKCTDSIREEKISNILKQSLYSIHIIDNDFTILHSASKMQYEIAKKQSSLSCCYKNILWILDANARDKLDTIMFMNPVVIGNDYESLFDILKSLDDEKNKKINELKKTFSPNKWVFMFYDFLKDHDSDLRIKLKTMIEEHSNILVKFSMPNASLEKDKDDLDTCDAGCIFYGATDTQWFAMRQSTLIDAGYARSKAICLDEPEIEKKASRDVSKNAFITIKGKNDLDIGVKKFIAKIQ